MCAGRHPFLCLIGTHLLLSLIGIHLLFFCRAAFTPPVFDRHSSPPHSPHRFLIGTHLLLFLTGSHLLPCLIGTQFPKF